MLTSAGDQELVARQAALQAEAADVLAGLALESLFGDVGPVLVVGSYVSGLMCWRDLDVGLLARVDFSPSDVLNLLKRVVSCRDSSGSGTATSAASAARRANPEMSATTSPFDLDAGQGRWRIDLSIWLRDLHHNVAASHEPGDP